MSALAPRIITVKIPVDKIGEVIGPKGKMINQIQDETGADITIEDDGTIYIGATDGPSAEAARTTINAIANPQMPEIGERYLGTVVKTTTFGAFISLLPGKDGLLHIRELQEAVAGASAVDNVEDVVQVGQKVQVEIKEIDPRGKLSLMPVIEDEPAAEAAGRSGRRRGLNRVTALRPGSWSIDPDQEPGSTVTLLSPDQGGLVRRTVLPGGLRVITEHVPGVRSAAFGIWVGVGSRDETHAQMGSAHYLEHLLFKGTRTRAAMEISVALDAVGGEMNAFTSKEHTCFYARVLDRDLPLAIDVISDIVTSALLRAEDVDAERGVILEEIAMRDDDPSDLVHDEFCSGMYGDDRPRSVDPGHPRDDRVHQPRGHRLVLPRALHARRPWWSPRPAPSTMTRSCGW